MRGLVIEGISEFSGPTSFSDSELADSLRPVGFVVTASRLKEIVLNSPCFPVSERFSFDKFIRMPKGFSPSVKGVSAVIGVSSSAMERKEERKREGRLAPRPMRTERTKTGLRIFESLGVFLKSLAFSRLNLLENFVVFLILEMMKKAMKQLLTMQ